MPNEYVANLHRDRFRLNACGLDSFHRLESRESMTARRDFDRTVHGSYIAETEADHEHVGGQQKIWGFGE
jgi:hypothetical protein